MKKNITAYIGVGSNISPEENISRALTELRGKVLVSAVSSVYRTTPLIRKNNTAFLNCVWQVKTGFKARELKFRILRPIEEILGREHGPDPYAPRTIDLDLILYGNNVFKEPGLNIPDPDIYLRPFLIIPLYELAPGLILSDTGTPVSELAAKIDKKNLCEQPDFTQRLRQILFQEKNKHG